jgi:hypothetical protein
MKSDELFTVTKAHVDISNAYSPELWIKHKGKGVKKDRKVALPAQFTTVYQEYISQYNIADILFPITDRFVQMLFADLKKQTKIGSFQIPVDSFSGPLAVIGWQSQP